MKYTQAKEITEPSCLPPEAYIRLMRSIENLPAPKFRSSVFPNSSIKSIPFKK